MSGKALAAGVFSDVLEEPAASALPLTMAAQADAGFLYRKTGKIDELVAERRRLIELLKKNARPSYPTPSPNV